MSPAEALKRFNASKNIGYDQWHDGEPYDLEAFAQMAPADRDNAAAEARAKSSLDWRDMDVLGAHGSRESIERLRDILAVGATKDRGWALRKLIDIGQTPGGVADVQLAHVIEAMKEIQDVMPGLDIALSHGGPMTKLALLRGIDRQPQLAINFAATLLDMTDGTVDAGFDARYRPTLIKLHPGTPKDEHDRAYATFCAWIGIDPATIPAPGASNERAWAERMWGQTRGA